jgi:hypothetical protein
MGHSWAIQIGPGVTPLPLPPVVVVPRYANNKLDTCLTELYRLSSPRSATQRRAQGAKLVPPLPQPDGPRGPRRDLLLRRADEHGVRCRVRRRLPQSPRMETHVPYFGSSCAFCYMNPDRRNFSYMDTFLSRLERVSYRDGETLSVAPYNFRYAVALPGHLSRVGNAFFACLKGLVERTSHSTADSRSPTFATASAARWRTSSCSDGPYCGAGGLSGASCRWRRRWEVSSWACSCSSPATTSAFHLST